MDENKLSLAEQVDTLFRSCLFNDDEMEEGKPKPGLEPVIAEGIVMKVGFHPGRIVEAKPKVQALIAQIVNNEFLKSKGGGMTFLNLCIDRTGQQWGEHRTQEQLVTMAIANGLAGYCLPKDMWSVLPGGMPYVWFEG